MLTYGPSSTGEKKDQDIVWLSRVGIAPIPPCREGGRLHRNRWQLSRGISGRLAVEWVAALLWNRWQTSNGIRTDDEKYLWQVIIEGGDKQHNSQMDVVTTLWRNDWINREKL